MLYCFGRQFLLSLLMVCGYRATCGERSQVTVSGDSYASFSLSWPSATPTARWLVNVWTNGLRGVSAGKDLIAESFTSVPARNYRQDWALEELNSLSDYGQWQGELVRGCPTDDHAVVLGSTLAVGWLLSGELPGSGPARIRLRMARHTDEDTAPVLVALVNGCLTNIIGMLTLQTGAHAFRDYRLDIPNFAAGSRLFVSSQLHASGRECGRVAVSAISFSVDFNDGFVSDEPVVSNRLVTTNVFECVTPSRVLYHYSIAGQLSETYEGTVDMADPLWMRCWVLSEMLPKPGGRAIDLSSVGRISKMEAWTNGVDGLHAFTDTGPMVSVRPRSENPSYGGLYLYAAETAAGTNNAPALLGTGTSGVSLVLVLRQDLGRALRELELSYEIRRLRVGGRNGLEMTLSVAYVDSFDCLDGANTPWLSLPAGDFSTSDTDRAYDMILAESLLRRSKYVFIRWRVPRQANSSMIGIADIHVTGTVRKSGMLVSVK